MLGAGGPNPLAEDPALPLTSSSGALGPRRARRGRHVGAPCTLEAAAGHWAALSDVVPNSHLPGSLAVLREVPSRFISKGVIEDGRKTDAREGRSRRRAG